MFKFMIAESRALGNGHRKKGKRKSRLKPKRNHRVTKRTHKAQGCKLREKNESKTQRQRQEDIS